MREIFPGYYRPTQEEFSGMWQGCIFVLDANVLLNIYRYSPDTRDELLDVLEYLKDRIWIPHQAMLEYHENREEVISHQYAITTEIETALIETSQEIETNYKRGHPFADTKIITETIKEAIEKIKASIAQAESKYPNLLENDPLLERLSSLFSSQIGSEYSPKRLDEIYKEFEQRFRLQIPPGYRDKTPKREGFKKYGDGVLWFQVIDYAKSQKKPIILITDDQKDDWWRIEKGKTLGPRPELAAEIGSKAKVSFYMYNASQFLKYAKEFLGLQVKQEAIEEVRDVSEQSTGREGYTAKTAIRRAFQAENAVQVWLRRAYPENDVRESYANYGTDFILVNADGTRTGIMVKYSIKGFTSGYIKRLIGEFTTKMGNNFERLLIILVCETMEDAAQTLVKLPRIIDIPPTLTIMVGFMDGENFYRPFGTPAE